jgi:hypothetical protein
MPRSEAMGLVRESLEMVVENTVQAFPSMTALRQCARLCLHLISPYDQRLADRCCCFSIWKTLACPTPVSVHHVSELGSGKLYAVPF